MANASRDGRALIGLGVVLLALSGCGGDDPAQQTNVAPTSTAIAAPASVTTAAPTPAQTPVVDISRDKVERGVTPPPATMTRPTDFVVNVTPKRFTDPPLPPELNDDGGLKPLPKPGH